MATPVRTPFVRAVVRTLERLYKPQLADRSWDNVGLLLEPPPVPSPEPRHRVLLTVDLTRSVVTEALARQVTFIVTYHPIIFRGLKAIVSTEDSQQDSLLRLAQAGIAVYSPHTAVDAAVGGVNDWLADGLVGDNEEVGRWPVKAAENGEVGEGMGRVLELRTGAELEVLVERVKKFIGMDHIAVARSMEHRRREKITRIALCAGSGSSVLSDAYRNAAPDKRPELFFTGELSHHEALAAVEKGVSVITCFHSNTERGFLRDRMMVKLRDVLTHEWELAEVGEREGKKWFDVLVSESDHDPYEIL